MLKLKNDTKLAPKQDPFIIDLEHFGEAQNWLGNYPDLEILVNQGLLASAEQSDTWDYTRHVETGWGYI